MSAHGCHLHFYIVSLECRRDVQTISRYHGVADILHASESASVDDIKCTPSMATTRDLDIIGRIMESKPVFVVNYY